MSQNHAPITRVLSIAEALGSLAALLPLEQHGIAVMQRFVAAELKRCGEELDELLPPHKFTQNDS